MRLPAESPRFIGPSHRRLRQSCCRSMQLVRNLHVHVSGIVDYQFVFFQLGNNNHNLKLEPTRCVCAIPLGIQRGTATARCQHYMNLHGALARRRCAGVSTSLASPCPRHGCCSSAPASLFDNTRISRCDTYFDVGSLCKCCSHDMRNHLSIIRWVSGV